MSKLRYLAAAALFACPACDTVEPVGFLGAVGDTMDGNPIISDEEFVDKAPDMNEIPEERSGGILQWKVR